MRRLLKLQILLVLLVLLAGGLCVADVLVRRTAEEALAAAVEQDVPGTRGASATIGSFPFIGRLIVSGEVPLVTVRAAETRAGQLPLRDVAVTVHDVRLDTGAAVAGRVHITSAGRGSLAASVSEADLSGRVPGVRVVLRPGRADVTGPGGIGGELVTTTKGRLLLRAAGRTIGEILLPQSALLPCEPDVTIVQGALTLACSFDQVPAALLRAADGR